MPERQTEFSPPELIKTPHFQFAIHLTQNEGGGGGGGAVYK